MANSSWPSTGTDRIFRYKLEGKVCSLLDLGENFVFTRAVLGTIPSVPQ